MEKLEIKVKNNLLTRGKEQAQEYHSQVEVL